MHYLAMWVRASNYEFVFLLALLDVGLNRTEHYCSRTRLGRHMAVEAENDKLVVPQHSLVSSPKKRPSLRETTKKRKEIWTMPFTDATVVSNLWLACVLSSAIRPLEQPAVCSCGIIIRLRWRTLWVLLLTVIFDFETVCLLETVAFGP